jgi:hypothetical protein
MNSICSICLEFMYKFKKLTKCGHQFHQTCIEKWFEKNNTCPLCRETNDEEPISAGIATSPKLTTIKTIYFLKLLKTLKNKSTINFYFADIDDETFGVFNFHDKKLIKILSYKDVDQSYKF